MISTLVVTTPATSLALLTVDEQRAAAGVSGTAQDAALVAIEARVAAAVMSECRIAVGASAPPTLLQETLTETFRFVSANMLILSRRHEVEIVSVTVDGTALDAEASLIDPEAGFLYRVSGDAVCHWHGAKVVVVYKAGFATVPPDLKMAAADFMRLSWAESTRDPALKREVIDIDGLQRKEREYWVGSVPGQRSEGAVPDVVSGQLARFRNGPFV